MTYEEKIWQDACKVAKENSAKDNKMQTFWYFMQLFAIGAVYALLFVFIDLKF
jgi:hypothetical protein